MNGFSIYTLKLLFWFVFSVFFHEWGHIIIAKKQGIYKGWDIAFGSIVVKLEHKYNSRWDYLSGFAFGLITIPLGLLFGINIIHMLILQLFTSILDFIIVIAYNKIPDKEK